MKHKHLVIIGSIGITILLGGCASVKSMKIPDFDFMKLPEFREEAEHIGDYPSVVNAPQIPTDLRTSGQWDKDVKRILHKQEAFSLPPDMARAKSEAEILQETQKLQARVEEYKLGDPQ